ncbi:MAG TPA: DNA-processing protein DprA [Casimicrobiaceae bacterium]|nr:DNA-processing protein DprA [Casimicrobiaceae bacterium]
MALDSRSLAWATLAHKALPQRALVALLREFGDAESVLAASRAQIARVASPAAADQALAPLDREALGVTSRWLDDASHHLIAWDDADYPQALLELGHAPPVLFEIGRRELLARPAFAIVGSRHGTPQGLDTAREFAHALGAAGLTIVSGLALGIDAAAHEGALGTDGSTLAVVGTGLDRVYPARNRDLAMRIARDGVLLSEYLPGTPPRKENFPRRNRLISGLARGVLVVEATLSSGSLITARLAGDQGREVFAIPGSIHSPFAKGCHKLIREGATLVETAQDVLDVLRPGAVEGRAPDERAPVEPQADATRLLVAMGYDPVSVDALVERTGAPAQAITAELVTLELDGRIATLPGGYWQRLGPRKRAAS